MTRETSQLVVHDVFPDEGVFIELAGDFDRQAAFSIGCQLLQAPPSAKVHLDFRRVHAIRDAALAVLAEALLSAEPEHVVVHGLSHHQELILRYLGVDIDRFEQ